MIIRNLSRIQPQYPPSLSSSMLDKLAVFIFAGFQPYGIVPPSITVATNARIDVGSVGIGWRSNGVGCWSAQVAPIVTSNGAGTGDYTIFALADPVSHSVSSVVFSQYADGINNQTRLQANMNSSLADSPGGMTFMDYAGVFSQVGVASGVCDGNPHFCMGIRRGTTYELWVDGSLIASATQTVRNIYTATNQQIQIGGTGQATARPMLAGDFVYMAGGFNRALSHFEATDFGKNWWTFPFSFADTKLPAYQPADSIPVPPVLSNPSVSDITTTTALPSVKVEF